MDVSFPYALEDDGLELTSLFQYDGQQPGLRLGGGNRRRRGDSEK